MAAKNGRLEGRITLSANQTLEATDGGGTFTVTVVAGNYYPTELVAAFQSAFDTAFGASMWTVTFSNGETGTGRVTVTAATGPWSITWTTTPLRDALGFTANISDVTGPSTGAQSARPIWLPNVPKRSMYGDSAFTSAAGLSGYGSLTTDGVSTVGPTNRVYSLVSQYAREHRGVVWEGIAPERALRHFETVVGQSIESFYLDAFVGRVSTYVPVNTLVRFYPDADVATYAVGRLIWPAAFDLDALVPGWLGRWNFNLPPLKVETT